MYNIKSRELWALTLMLNARLGEYLSCRECEYFNNMALPLDDKPHCKECDMNCLRYYDLLQDPLGTSDPDKKLAHEQKILLLKPEYLSSLTCSFERNMENEIPYLFALGIARHGRWFKDYPDDAKGKDMLNYDTLETQKRLNHANQTNNFNGISLSYEVVGKNLGKIHYKRWDDHLAYILDYVAKIMKEVDKKYGVPTVYLKANIYDKFMEQTAIYEMLNVLWQRPVEDGGYLLQRVAVDDLPDVVISLFDYQRMVQQRRDSEK